MAASPCPGPVPIWLITGLGFQLFAAPDLA